MAYGITSVGSLIGAAVGGMAAHGVTERIKNRNEGREQRPTLEQSLAAATGQPGVGAIRAVARLLLLKQNHNAGLIAVAQQTLHDMSNLIEGVTRGTTDSRPQEALYGLEQASTLLSVGTQRTAEATDQFVRYANSYA